MYINCTKMYWVAGPSLEPQWELTAVPLRSLPHQLWLLLWMSVDQLTRNVSVYCLCGQDYDCNDGVMIQTSGLSRVIGESLSIFKPLPTPVIVLVLVLIGTTFTTFTSNVSTTTILLPITAELVSCSSSGSSRSSTLCSKTVIHIVRLLQVPVMQTIATYNLVAWWVCLSHGCTLQKWLSGRKSCLWWRLFGALGTLYYMGVPDPPWKVGGEESQCNHHWVTLTTCLFYFSLYNDFCNNLHTVLWGNQQCNSYLLRLLL